jgi:hypothetical protein
MTLNLSQQRGFECGLVVEARWASVDLERIRVTAGINRDVLSCLPRPFPGNAALFDSVARSVRYVEDLAESSAAVAARLVKAISEDPVGILAIAHLAERLADALARRDDTEIDRPPILILATLLHLLTGEPDMARFILDETCNFLQKRLLTDTTNTETACQLTLAGFALATAYLRLEEPIECLTTAVGAWVITSTGIQSPDVKRFAAEVYGRILKELGEIDDADGMIADMQKRFPPKPDATSNWLLDPVLWTYRELSEEQQ